MDQRVWQRGCISVFTAAASQLVSKAAARARNLP
jgi:hypothetical protein